MNKTNYSYNNALLTLKNPFLPNNKVSMKGCMIYITLLNNNSYLPIKSTFVRALKINLLTLIYNMLSGALPLPASPVMC